MDSAITRIIMHKIATCQIIFCVVAIYFAFLCDQVDLYVQKVCALRWFDAPALGVIGYAAVLRGSL